MLATKTDKFISTKENIENVEATMLDLPQADCPIAHHFGPGIYIRELTMPAGIIAIGHMQKKDHLNVILTGKVAMIEDDNIRIVEAPMIFTGKPGRKIGYVIETCVWQNVYATDETDIDKLEDMFIDKSDVWKEHNEKLKAKNTALHEEDRKDFFKLVEDSGFTPEIVKEQSENESDQIEMPNEYKSILSVRDSCIHGKGVFLSWPVLEGTIIAPARIGDLRTPAGRYTNHSKTPNAEFKKIGDNIFLVSKVGISGCKGGDMGEEVTIDYRQALSLSGIELNKKESLCQQ